MTTLFFIAMVAIGLVVTGIVSSIFIACVVAVATVCLVAGIVGFFGAVFSWPVLLAIVVIWLLLRDKPQRQERRYYR